MKIDLETAIVLPNATVGLVGLDADLTDFAGTISFLYNMGYRFSGARQDVLYKTRCVSCVGFDIWRGVEYAANNNGTRMEKCLKAAIPLPYNMFRDFDLLEDWAKYTAAHKQIMIVDCRYQDFEPVISGLMHTLMPLENTSFFFLLSYDDLKVREVTAELDYALEIRRSPQGVLLYDEIDFTTKSKIEKIEKIDYEFLPYAV